MGDPTLRMHVVAPPSNLLGVPVSGRLGLTWSPSPDAVAGYQVYRSASQLGSYVPLNQALVTGTSFEDPIAGSGGSYMLRAVKLQTSGSGSYWNASQGIFVRTGPLQPSVSVRAIDPVASRVGSDPAVWQFERDGETSNELIVRYVLVGTANDGIDFQRSSSGETGLLVIPAGASTARVNLSTLPSASLVGERRTTLFLQSNAAYEVGLPRSATIQIGGNIVAE